MKLFSKNAESLLFEKVKSLTERHDSWRCLYINFSDHKEEYSDGLRTHVVTNIIKEMLEGEDGYIYLCEDGDVFILFQGKASLILSKLGEQFKGLSDAKGNLKPTDEIYSLFDLSAHWEAFFTLCKKKAAQISEEVARAAIAAQAVPQKNTLREPDADLFRAALLKRAGRKRMLVLLVEDDPFTRRLVNTSIKGDYDVIEAGDGNEAIRQYETLAPDAVFLDIGLPDVNGQVILNKLIALDKSVFVVMLSANSIKENILAALEKGAQGFVAKPFAKEKLMHYLRLCATLRQGRATGRQEVSHAPSA